MPLADVAPVAGVLLPMWLTVICGCSGGADELDARVSDARATDAGTDAEIIDAWIADAPIDAVAAGGITVSPTSCLITSENGDMAEFTIVLDSAPTATVSIDLTASDGSDAMVDPLTVAFGSGDWNTPKTITVIGLDDASPDGAVEYTVETALAVSGDPGYDGFDAEDVLLANADNDGPGIVVTPTTGLTTTEAGGTACFAVVLETAPSFDVLFTLSSSDSDEGTPSPTSLVFSSASWNTPQIVTVAGVDDAIADGDVGYTISLSVVSVDNNYDSIDPGSVAVTNLDND